MHAGSDISQFCCGVREGPVAPPFFWAAVCGDLLRVAASRRIASILGFGCDYKPRGRRGPLRGCCSQVTRDQIRD